MRLTNAIRESIIAAVMADVPQVDYAEKEIAIRRKAERRNLPASVFAVYDNPATKRFIDTSYGHTQVRPGRSYRSYVCICEEACKKLNKAEEKQVAALVEKQVKQDERVKSAREAITAAVNAYSTTKALAEAMPEISKYIPKDADGIKNLPARIDIVTTLKAAGLKLAA